MSSCARRIRAVNSSAEIGRMRAPNGFREEKHAGRALAHGKFGARTSSAIAPNEAAAAVCRKRRRVSLGNAEYMDMVESFIWCDRMCQVRCEDAEACKIVAKSRFE